MTVAGSISDKRTVVGSISDKRTVVGSSSDLYIAHSGCRVLFDRYGMCNLYHDSYSAILTIFIIQSTISFDISYISEQFHCQITCQLFLLQHKLVCLWQPAKLDTNMPYSAGKGISKRKGFLFKKGCVTRPDISPEESTGAATDSQWVALDEPTYNQVVSPSLDNLIQGVDADGNPGTARFLRPRRVHSAEPICKSEPDYKYSAEEYRIIHQRLSTQMWNTIFKEHMNSPCDQPNFTLSSEQKRGAGWIQQYKCENCTPCGRYQGNYLK